MDFRCFDSIRLMQMSIGWVRFAALLRLPWKGNTYLSIILYIGYNHLDFEQFVVI